MEHKDKPWYEQEAYVKVGAFLLLLLMFLGIHLLVPDFFPKIFKLTTSGDVDELITFLRSFGVWAIFVSFLLDILVNAVGFLPSIFISTGNGLLFGLPLVVLV